MAVQPLATSPEYQAFAEGLRELHRLTLAGKDESPEADAVRDAMDKLWEAMSEDERKLASVLSENLYSISEPRVGAIPEMSLPPQ
jgi:hypothetical protein